MKQVERFEVGNDLWNPWDSVSGSSQDLVCDDDDDYRLEYNTNLEEYLEGQVGELC